MYKKYILKPTAENKAKYKDLKNKLRTTLKAAEENYYINIIEGQKNNLKTMWDTIGTIINPQKMKRKQRITQINYNNKTIRSDQEIANALNSHFSSVGKKLPGKI